MNPPSAAGTLANREGAAGLGTLYDGSSTFFYPPHTLATVAAVLRDAGHAVRAVDALVQENGPRDLADADAVGVFISYASLDSDLAFLAVMRGQTAARLIAFGPAMRFVGEQVLARAAVDAVLSGEAEGFFATLLRVASSDESIWRTPRLWTPADVQAAGCDADGFVQNLDALPFPAWELLPVEKYPLLTVLSSRGCPDPCVYCPYAAAQGHRFRSRSAQSVLDELTWLCQRFHPARVVFRDPVFAYDRGRAVAICEGILRRGLELSWEFESRPEHLDADLLCLMQSAGCQWVKIGLETTDSHLLQRLRRVSTPEEAASYVQRVTDVVTTCDKIGLNCRLFVMAGLPGQDVASAQRTQRFLATLRPTALNVKSFDAYPGLDVVSEQAADCSAQLAVLKQAQAAVQSQRSASGLLGRGRRFVHGVLRRPQHGPRDEAAQRLAASPRLVDETRQARPRMTSRRTRYLYLAVAVLLVALGAQMWSAVRSWSPTFDEPYHILRSYVYLKTGDSALLERGGHPPLTNLLSVAPLLLRSDIALPSHEPGWPQVRAFKDLFSAADEFFWQLGNDAEGILTQSRLPMLCLSLCLAGLVFWWAKERNGMGAGLLALGLYALDPNLIAHSSVVTTDLGATFFVFVTAYCVFKFCQRPSWRKLGLTGIVFGLAQATKFSCLFLAPIVLLTLAIWAFTGRQQPPLFALPGQARIRGRRWPRRTAAPWQRVYLVLGLWLLILLIGFVALWAVYGFQVRPLLPHESSHPVLDRYIPGDNAALRRVVYALAEHAPVPAPAYFAGLAWLQRYSQAGHPSFLLGQYGRGGWWYYFPVALAIKTPIPTLLVLLVALYLSLRHRREAHDEYFLLVPMALFFASSMFSSIDIGYRNILPVLPLAFVYTSKVAAQANARVVRAALAVLGVWLALGTILVGPHYLAYFNELVGGSNNGYKYLADSNLDWGQDLKNLKRYVDAHRVTTVYLDYFGAADPGYSGIRSLPLPDTQPAADAPLAYYAVSATSLLRVYAPGGGPIDWIAAQRPVDKVGFSIFIYRLPAGERRAVSSTLSRQCLMIAPDRKSVQSVADELLILYAGKPDTAYVELTSCGVNAGMRHAVYLNGQFAFQVQDDACRTCLCGGSGNTVTYALSDPALVINGSNIISITNDADVSDSWMAQGARLLLEGNLDAAVQQELSFTSSYDGSERRAVYQIPMGYDPMVPTPLLVSISGTGDDRWDGLSLYAGRANREGWLLLAPDVRQVNVASRGRTASLATQHDIMDALAYMQAHLNVDSRRIYLIGFSTGSGVAMTVAAKYPDVFAAVVDWAGPVDLLAWARQRPDIHAGLTASDFGCAAEGANACPFEWQRRSAREMAMNLKYVPVALVHGRADDLVPFAQAESLLNTMREFYDPDQYNKLALWYEGGHLDSPTGFRPLGFLSQFRLQLNPPDIMIRTDESKNFYWLRILQQGWKGKTSEGFSTVLASYDANTRVISATVQDERSLDGGNLPLEISVDLSIIGFDASSAYVVEDRDLATGDLTILPPILPNQGRLALQATRDALGQVHHQYRIYPAVTSSSRRGQPAGDRPRLGLENWCAWT